jgi:lipopolysaccharide/colanic/teichoic acid biosynthesis glycosyltransferase
VPDQVGLRLCVKRAFDRSCALCGLVITAPILAGAAVAVRVSMGDPILFVQERPGRGGKPFRLIKFRTMREAADQDARPLPDEERLTKVGRLLRALSIDELPQLLNVLRGELSLVGPRPLLMRYLPRYSPAQARRHEVLPGLTGWAQINGRNALSWEERFELDIWYVDHWSLTLDAKILAKTLVCVIRREGIAQEGHATMPEFTGTTPSGERHG